MNKVFWGSVALMMAQTIGAGIFGLPFVFAKSGWVVSLVCLVVLSLVLSFVHRLYARALDKVGSHHRLTGILTHYFGFKGRIIGLLVVLGGLTLTLVLYLVLGSQFLQLIFPKAGIWSLPIFWLLVSFPLLFRVKKFFAVETLGVGIVSLLTLAVFFSGIPKGWMGQPFLVPQNIFFPFGLMVFSLAGWPAIQQILQRSRQGGLSIYETGRAISYGTFGAAIIYTLFSFGVLGQNGLVIGEGVGGLISGTPIYFTGIILLLGIFSIWNAYGPMSREIEASLREDLGWSSFSSRFTILFIPPALVLLGLKDFLAIGSLIGGVFLGLQYALLLYVADRTALLRKHHAFMSAILKLVFILAAVYEIYYFIVK